MTSFITFVDRQPWPWLLQLLQLTELTDDGGDVAAEYVSTAHSKTLAGGGGGGSADLLLLVGELRAERRQRRRPPIRRWPT